MLDTNVSISLIKLIQVANHSLRHGKQMRRVNALSALKVARKNLEESRERESRRRITTRKISTGKRSEITELSFDGSNY